MHPAGVQRSITHFAKSAGSVRVPRPNMSAKSTAAVPAQLAPSPSSDFGLCSVRGSKGPTQWRQNIWLRATATKPTMPMRHTCA